MKIYSSSNRSIPKRDDDNLSLKKVSDKRTFSRRKSYNIFPSIICCCKRKKKVKYNLHLEEDSKDQIKVNKNDIINSFNLDNISNNINSDTRININETKDNNNNKLKKEEIMRIINTQDFIDGYWENNDETKYVKEKYKKEYQILKNNKMINNNEKIIITILIIYDIEKDYPELLNELSLVIKKAKIFIKKETRNSFEEFIKEI